MNTPDAMLGKVAGAEIGLGTSILAVLGVDGLLCLTGC